jgi:hypothetical protein
MGSGELNVALDAGENALVGAGPADDGEGDDPRDEGDEEGDDPRDEDPFAGIGEHADDEPVDEWLAMTPEERVAAARRALDAAGEDLSDAPGDEAPGATVGQDPTTLRTPPPKDPRAAAYDAQVDARFAQVEAVRLRSNPPGAPLDPSGIATVVSGEGQRLQQLNLDPGLDAPLRDSRGTEVTRSTVLGLLLIRDMYIAMANALANVFDAIREGDLAYKRDRTRALYGVSQELAQLRDARDSAKARWDDAIRSAASIRGNVSEESIRQMADSINRLKQESEAATAAYEAGLDRIERQFPEINILVDDVPLWEALAGSGGEGMAADLDRVGIYNRHLEQGAADLRTRAAAARGHDTLDELMEYGRPEYVRVRDRVRLDGRSVGSDRTELLMNQVEAVRAAYDIHVAVDHGWTKVLLATTGVGIIAAGWVILPLSAVAYGCLAVSVVDVTLEGSELVVRYGDARAMEEAAPLVGWRHVVTAQDRERAAVGGTVLAAIGVGVDTAVIRSIRVVGPGQCAATDIPPAAQRVGELAGAARTTGAVELGGLRADDIVHWRGSEAAAIERARGYGVTLTDATDAKLAQLDEVVLAAERAGVPRPVIDEGLNRIRDTPVSMVNELERSSGSYTPFDVAIKDFRIRMVIAEAIQKDFTIISRIEDTAYLSKLGGSQGKLLILEPTDLNRLVAKVAVDRVPGATTYTTQEADLAREILRQDDASKLYVFDPQQSEGGLYRLLDADDIGGLRRIFGTDAARPPTIVDAPPAGPPPDLPPRQIDTEADTNLDMLDPSLDRTPTQVLRPEEIDELPPDAPTVRLPARALEDADRTPTQVLRQEEIDELPADAPTVRLPARALEDADRTPTQILRQDEILRCPPAGPCGPNEIIPHSADPARFIRWHYGEGGTPAADAYETAVRELGAENVDGIAGGFAQGRARVWSWPEGTSYLDAKRMDKFGGELYDPAIVARMPPDVQRAYATARELGAERLPSDLDIAVDAGIDAGRLNDVAKKIYDDTGVLIEFTDSRIRGAAGAQAPAGQPAPAPPVPPAGTPVSSATTGIVDPATSTGVAMLGGPSGQGGTSAPIEVVILSIAGSTGPVMEAFFVNHGKEVRIQGEGLVLEPVADADPATLRRVEEIRAAALHGKPLPPPGADGAPGGSLDERAGSAVIRVVLDAYCLQADLDVPTQGMLFRIAGPAGQAEFAGLPAIVEASRRMFDAGALNPSTDPEDYFHSIRQWALWAEEKDMDAEKFEDAFVAHARRNIVASGQTWNAEVESVVRDYAPGRWEDVETVLEAAGVR